MLAPPASGVLVEEFHMHDVGKEAGSWAVLGPGHAQEGKGAQDNHEGKEGKGAQGTTPEDSDEVKDHDENKEANDEGKGDKGKAALDSLHSLQDNGAQGPTQDKGAQGTAQDKDKWKPYVSVHVYGSPEESIIECVAKLWPAPNTVVHIHMSDPSAPSNVEFSSLGAYRGSPK